MARLFLGTYTPRLDDKGRLFLPAKFRDDLSAGLVMTKGQERCLYVFPMTVFQATAERLQAGSQTERRVRDFRRVFFASAHDEVPDRQGRVTIPPSLRTYAGLDRDVAVVGANDRIEIWNLAAWTAYVEESEAGFAEANEEVIPGAF